MVALAACALVLAGMAQVSGIVRDPAGAPVAGATVSVRDGDALAVTGQDGRFVLEVGPVRMPPRRLLVRERGRIVPVPVASIDWLEAEGDYVRVRVGPASHLVERTLAEMERLLASRGFARVHRGAVVNLDRVEELHVEGSGRYRLRLRGGPDLVVSRSHSRRFRDGVL